MHLEGGSEIIHLVQQGKWLNPLRVGESEWVNSLSGQSGLIHLVQGKWPCYYML